MTEPPRTFSSDELDRAVNAAADAAAGEVFDFANHFIRKRKQYEPLEALAGRVQRAALDAGARIAKEEQ